MVICILGSKSSYGDSNERSFVQSQFGLVGTTGSAYGRSWESDRQLGETNTSSKAATDHSAASGEDGWHPDDLSTPLHSCQEFSISAHERLLRTALMSVILEISKIEPLPVVCYMHFSINNIRTRSLQFRHRDPRKIR